jgi:UDP-galactopyranose mutase
MGVKKIIHNAFEQVREVGANVVKSSAQQVVETLSPWDMIRNSFIEGERYQHSTIEQKKDGRNNTPLNFKQLDKDYANQDEQKIKQMTNRLFNMVRQGDSKVGQEKQNKQANLEREGVMQTNEKQRIIIDKQNKMAASSAPQGKTGRGSALSRKKRKATEPQPAETKPGSSKQ